MLVEKVKKLFVKGSTLVLKKVAEFYPVNVQHRVDFLLDAIIKYMLHLQIYLHETIERIDDCGISEATF